MKRSGNDVRKVAAAKTRIARATQEIAYLIEEYNTAPPEDLLYVQAALMAFADPDGSASSLDDVFGLRRGRGRQKADKRRLALAKIIYGIRHSAKKLVPFEKIEERFSNEPDLVKVVSQLRDKKDRKTLFTAKTIMQIYNGFYPTLLGEAMIQRARARRKPTEGADTPPSKTPVLSPKTGRR